MLFRRVLQHVKDQNWTAVGIDFAIVVVGVFMGIQLGNWNEQRMNEGLEEYYLERLRDDLQRSMDLSTENLNFAQQVPDGATLVLQALRECELAADKRDEFASGLYRLGKLNRSVFVDTTFEEMRSTGTLNVISDRTLVTRLIELQRMERNNDREFRLIEAWTSDQVKEIHSRVIFELTDKSDGWRLTWDDVGIDFDLACDDKTLIAAVGSLRNYAFEDVRRAESGLERVANALNAVNAALGQNPLDNGSDQ